jgi:hypothetical protein
MKHKWEVIPMRDLLFRPSISRIQDELETVPLCPNLSISVRNLAFMGIKGISRIQLVIAHSGYSR